MEKHPAAKQDTAMLWGAIRKRHPSRDAGPGVALPPPAIVSEP
jgi:hypothetical protein